MTLAIHELESKPAVAAADVEAFLDAHTFPLVEGRQVTFVYHGATDAVYLQHWVYGLPEAQAFEVEQREGMPVMRSKDAREGPRAFLEKRAPVFTGE